MQKVKLIIEIPKKEYEAFKELIAINMGGRCLGKGIIQTCLNAVKNGTPLDDVKAEIEQMPIVLLNGCEHIDRTDTLEIIDKHIGDKE